MAWRSVVVRLALVGRLGLGLGRRCITPGIAASCWSASLSLVSCPAAINEPNCVPWAFFIDQSVWPVWCLLPGIRLFSSSTAPIDLWPASLRASTVINPASSHIWVSYCALRNSTMYTYGTVNTAWILMLILWIQSDSISICSKYCSRNEKCALAWIVRLVLSNSKKIE